MIFKPDPLNEPANNHLPQALPPHHRRRVASLISNNWRSPPPLPILVSASGNISARTILGISIKARPGLHHPSYPLLAPERQPVKHFPRGHSSAVSAVWMDRTKSGDRLHWGFLGIARGFFLKNPVPEILAGHGLRVTVGVFGVLFQLPGNFLKMTIELR
jgi:hypothetical protein